MQTSGRFATCGVSEQAAVVSTFVNKFTVAVIQPLNLRKPKEGGSSVRRSSEKLPAGLSHVHTQGLGAAVPLPRPPAEPTHASSVSYLLEHSAAFHRGGGSLPLLCQSHSDSLPRLSVAPTETNNPQQGAFKIQRPRCTKNCPWQSIYLKPLLLE